MTKIRTFRPISQQLFLLDLKVDNKQVFRQPLDKKPIQQIYSTREVVEFLSLDSATPLYRTKNEGSAYWHQPGSIQESRIVVPMGKRDKWAIYYPQVS